MALDIGWAVMAEGLEGCVDSIYFLSQWLVPLVSYSTLSSTFLLIFTLDPPNLMTSCLKKNCKPFKSFVVVVFLLKWIQILQIV